MKKKLFNPKTPYQKILLFLLTLFVSSYTYANSTCGHIIGYEFTNGTDEIALEDGGTYNINDLPVGFYLEMNTSGASESAVFSLQNTNTGQNYNQTENQLPYNFPRVSNGNSWNLGIGTFQICGKLFANNHGNAPRCDRECITITIEDEADCGEITDLVFTNGTESISIQNGETYELSDLPDGFYLEMIINGVSESATYYVKNLDTNDVETNVENELPYNFPGSNPWDLGLGTFKVDTTLYANNNAHHPKCDQYWVMFTIVDTPDCGEIASYEFTNGTDEITLEDGGTYNINDLPVGFYLEMNTSGASESAVFNIQNTGTGQTYNQTENVIPYNFPRVSSGDTWDLGFGTFQICGELFANNNGHDPLCDQECITITIEGEVNCGEIEEFKLTNGTDSVTIQNGGTYNINDLPDGFYLEMATTDPSESTVFEVRNTNTGQNVNEIDNDIPYTFPSNGGWDLGTGTFIIFGTLYANDNGEHPKCDHKCITITIEGLDCGSIEGLEFTNGTDTQIIEEGGVYALSELPDAFNLNLITNGNVGSIEYTVTNTDTGETETIVENVIPYTFPAGGAPWDLGVGTFTVTAKLFELSQTHGVLCDELTITFTIGEDTCQADAGTLTSDQDNICVVDDGKLLVFDPIEISATPNGDSQVPAGFSVVYVLTQGANLVIIDTSTSPVFEVTEDGEYTIHTLVYDPNTLDISIIDIGVTTGGDILALLIQGGGDICGDLDVTGAPIVIVNPNSGTLTPGASPVVLNEDGEATISATPNGDLNIPDGFESIYVLTQGPDLLIINAGPNPEFVVTEAGDYTIHTFVYDPATFDISIIEFGVTTGADVLAFLIQGGGNLCGSLDVTGAPIVVEEPPCLADAGTITADEANICVVPGGIEELTFDPVTISGTPNGDIIIPSGYTSIYVLTQGPDLVIIQTNATPSFEVTEEGLYTIHTLVYNPNTLDLSIIELGVTTGSDVLGLLIQGGGDICGSLDVAGAPIEIENPDAGTLTVDDSPVVLENGEATVSATPNGDSNVPDGYTTVYVLTQGIDLVILDTSTTPSFTVTAQGTYKIHTLVYNPNTLDLSTITPGVTTALEIEGLLYQAGGGICASLDVSGVQIVVEAQACEAIAGTLTADSNKTCVVNGLSIISATPNGDGFVPSGYLQKYVLTQGANSVILGISNNPEFSIAQASNYTIHSFIYDPNTFDVNDIDLGITTSQDVYAMTIDGEGNICASLDDIGVTITVEDPQAGTLTADNDMVILVDASVEISAMSNGGVNVPNGYNIVYVLTTQPDLIITATNDSPVFEVEAVGNYIIHTLVYDPNTLDLDSIIFDVTSASDILGLITQGGGDICASLDVAGAPITVLPNELSSNEIKLYPNPATYVVNVDTEIRSNEILNYSIIDLSGRHIFKGQVNSTNRNEANINLESLENGMYLVTFTSRYREITKKIQISK